MQNIFKKYVYCLVGPLFFRLTMDITSVLKSAPDKNGQTRFHLNFLQSSFTNLQLSGCNHNIIFLLHALRERARDKDCFRAALVGLGPLVWQGKSESRSPCQWVGPSNRKEKGKKKSITFWAFTLAHSFFFLHKITGWISLWFFC